MYVADIFGKVLIEKTKVQSATDRTVTVKGKRHQRLGAETSYFTNWSDAHTWVTASLKDEVARAKAVKDATDAAYQVSSDRLKFATKLKEPRV